MDLWFNYIRNFFGVFINFLNSEKKNKKIREYLTLHIISFTYQALYILQKDILIKMGIINHPYASVHSYMNVRLLNKYKCVC